MLDNLTIVITTYKRYGYLDRLLKFLLSYELRAKIIVLDSTPYQPEDRELRIRLNSRNVVWMRFDPDISPAQKIPLGVKEVETEFTVICADDDFLIPPAAKKCIEFLLTHPEYGSAQGQYFHHLAVRSLVYKGCSITPLYQMTSSGEDDKPIDRVMSYLSQRSTLPFYAVHRTKDFKKIWRQIEDLNINSALCELLLCTLSMCLGKMKKLPVFYSSRELNNIAIFDQTDMRRMYAPDQLKRVVRCLSFEIEPDDEIARQGAYSLVLEEVNSRRDYADALRPKPLITRGAMLLKNSLWLRVIYKELMTGGIDSSITSPQGISDFQKIKAAVLSKPLGKDEHNAAKIGLKKIEIARKETVAKTE
jgi:glycosyltransferase domain-containing protein